MTRTAYLDDFDNNKAVALPVNLKDCKTKENYSYKVTHYSLTAEQEHVMRQAILDKMETGELQVANATVDPKHAEMDIYFVYDNAVLHLFYMGNFSRLTGHDFSNFYDFEQNPDKVFEIYKKYINDWSMEYRVQQRVYNRTKKK